MSHFLGDVTVGNAKTSLTRLNVLGLDLELSQDELARIFSATGDYLGLFQIEGGTETEATINAQEFNW